MDRHGSNALFRAHLHRGGVSRFRCIAALLRERLGFRYLRSRGQRTNLSLFVWIGLGGVFLGVAALIVVLAVMTGFQDGIRERCAQPPTVTELHEVGSYRFHGEGRR